MRAACAWARSLRAAEPTRTSWAMAISAGPCCLSAKRVTRFRREVAGNVSGSPDVKSQVALGSHRFGTRLAQILGAPTELGHDAANLGRRRPTFAPSLANRSPIEIEFCGWEFPGAILGSVPSWRFLAELLESWPLRLDQSRQRIKCGSWGAPILELVLDGGAPSSLAETTSFPLCRRRCADCPRRRRR